MRFQCSLAPGGLFLDTGEAKAQGQCLEAVPIDLPLRLHGREVVTGPMPSFGGIIKTSDDLWRIIAFIRSVKPELA